MADDSPIKGSVQSVERAFELLEIMASAGGRQLRSGSWPLAPSCRNQPFIVSSGRC